MINYRSVTYRLHFSTKDDEEYLFKLSGTSRFIWNELLERSIKEYEEWKKNGSIDVQKPSVSFFSFNEKITQLKQEIDWLKEYPIKIYQSVAKHLSESYKKFFKDGGFPKFKAKYFTTRSFRLLQQYKIKDNKVSFPVPRYAKNKKERWYKLTGNTPYKDATPFSVSVYLKANKWYCTVGYKVNVEENQSEKICAIDRNCGNVALVDEDGHREIIKTPENKLAETKLKRHQRKLSRKKKPKKGEKRSRRRQKQQNTVNKYKKKLADIRKNHSHQVSRKIANEYGFVVVEDLKIKNMTKSAKGTKENPGKNVSQKRGLNRSIMNQNWGQLFQYLSYKCRQVIKVNPAYTSQTCSKCGHKEKENRLGRKFKCTQCGYNDHADLNAASNILSLGMDKINETKSTSGWRNRDSNVKVTNAQGDSFQSMICENVVNS